jgi:hypothetical protein
MKAISVMAVLVITATSLVLGQSKAKEPNGPSGNTEEAVKGRRQRQRLSHEHACSLVINGHECDTTTSRGIDRC